LRAQEILQILHSQQHGAINTQILPAQSTDLALHAEVARLKAELNMSQKLALEIEQLNMDELSPKQVFDYFWGLKQGRFKK